MADEDNKGSSSDTEWWIWLAGGIIALALLGNMSERVLDFLSSDKSAVVESGINSGTNPLELETNYTLIDQSADFFEKISDWFVTFSIVETFPTFTVILYVIIGLALLVFFYSKIQTNWLIAEWNKEIGYNRHADKIDQNPESDQHFQVTSSSTSMSEVEPEPPKDERWLHIESLIKSDQENDWRSAILEADIMLDELLLNLGYEGKTVAEKLQQVKVSDMKYLEDAWTAHKVRNRIAHDGNAFELDRDLFLKTIRQFERVFEEQFII